MKKKLEKYLSVKWLLTIVAAMFIGGGLLHFMGWI